MKFIDGDLFDQRTPLVIPVNGDTDRNGYAVMGTGVAYFAKRRMPSLPRMLGDSLKTIPQQTYVYQSVYDNEWNTERSIICLPVKCRWQQDANLVLIKRTVAEMVTIVRALNWHVSMPKIGTGHGHRDWETEILPILRSAQVDDRFTIINYQ